MYATNRLLGFESLTASFFELQSPQVPVKPTSEVQKLLDAAAKLPKADQLAGYEKALDAAIAAKDSEGLRSVVQAIYEWFQASSNSKSTITYFEAVLAQARKSMNGHLGALATLKVGEFTFSTGQSKQSVTVLRSAVSMFRGISDSQGVLTALIDLAFVYEKLEEFQNVFTTWDEVVTIQRNLNDRRGLVGSLGYLAILHENRSELMKALSIRTEVLGIQRYLGNKVETVWALSSISSIQTKLNNYEDSLRCLVEALAITRELKEYRLADFVVKSIAELHVTRKDFNQAFAYYTDLLSSQRGRADKTGIADTLISIADLHNNLGSIVKSLECYDEALALQRDLGDTTGLASTLNKIGAQYYEQGNVTKALLFFQESMKVSRSIDDERGVAVSVTNIASLYSDEGELDKAFHMYQQANDAFSSAKDDQGIASTTYHLAWIYAERQATSKALDLYKKSFELYRKLEDKSGMSNCLSGVAALKGSNGFVEESLILYRDVLDVKRSIDDKMSVAVTLNNIAATLILLGRLAEAYDALRESEIICTATGYKSATAQYYALFANLMDLVGNRSRAAGVREQASTLYSQLGDSLGLSLLHGRKGEALLEAGNPGPALIAFFTARDYRVKSALPTHLIDYMIGEAYLALGNHVDSLRYLKPVLDSTRRAGIGSGNSRALTILSRAYLVSTKPSLAEEPLRYALASSLRDRIPDDIAKVYSALADHALAMKDRDVAIIHLKRAIAARQVQRRGSIGLDDAMTASLSLKVAPDYRKLAGLLTDSGRLGEAMEVAELLKRSEAKVRGGDIASDTPADQGKISAAEAAYRKAAEDLGKLGDRERFLSKVKYPSDSVKAEIATMPAKLKVANKALTDALNRVIADEKAAGSAVGRMRDTGAAQARLAATLKRLGPGYAAVTVLCLPDSIRFLISIPTSLTMKRVTVAEKSLVGQVKALRDALLDPTSDPIPSAKALHTVLWAPIESELKRLGVKHVLLSLTGTARYVPFGALHNGTQYVVQGWGLSLYSPTVLEHIGDRATKQWSVLAAGNSTERTVDDGIGSKLRFTSLPGVRAELSRVRQSVGAGPPPILDNEFTLATLKDGLAKQPSVVHLASHFQFDPRAESLSFLLTGQGEVLRASDTTVLTKDAFKGVDLLTLSACQTGTFSETADGMEVEGIASLMQRKGAGAVMSTLWPVADASTAAFMGTFYTLRSQDPRRTKAWCLREAQLRMIRGEVAPPGAPKPVATRGTTSIKISTKGLRKDWSHPYHWAPFILQGNPL